jgi:zinc/manganese transport system substrate-binding protein
MRRHPVIAAVVAAALVAACGGDGSDRSGGGPAIAVTTPVLGDVVRNLVGELATVDVVMPAGADPHEFQPSARQAADLRDAELIVANGGGLEAGLDDTLETAEDDGVVVFRAIDHVEPLAADDEGDDHGHDDVDPHFFTDPSRMADAAAALSDTLAAEVPDLDTDGFRTQSDTYVADLRALDEEVADIVASVPPDRRRLVTNHDVFGYFADRYGFEVIGAVIPSATTEASASAGEIDDLATAVTAAGVPAVFTDTSAPADLVDTLAAEVGDVVVVELYSESLGEEGSGADGYAAMMRTNATRIADALAP